MAAHPQRIVERLAAAGTLPSAGDVANALGRAGGGDVVAFASPSQREGSKHADMAALSAVHDYLRNHPAAVEQVKDAIGYWADGKEESAAVHLRNKNDLEPVLEDLRRRFNQKATIGFAEDANGPDLMHVISVRESDPDKIHTDLSKHGVEYKTVVPGPTGSTVYNLDSGGVLRDPIAAYAREQRAHVDSVPGTVHFVGGDERPQTDPVKLALHESLNKAARVGDFFVKTPRKAGSPHAEEQAARVFGLIGLPHIPVRHQGGKVYARWQDGLQSISENPERVKEHYSPDRMGHLTFGEWLISAGDRIGRNYQTHPAMGLIGNDYGHAFHPLTDEWPNWGRRTEGTIEKWKAPPVESYKSLAATPSKYAEYHPQVSALPGLLRHLGLADREQHLATKVPAPAVQAALDNEKTLLDAAHKATEDLPDAERKLAVAAMKARIDAVRRHVTNRGPLTIGDLVRLTDEVRYEATARTPRPE